MREQLKKPQCFRDNELFLQWRGQRCLGVETVPKAFRGREGIDGPLGAGGECRPFDRLGVGRRQLLGVGRIVAAPGFGADPEVEVNQGGDADEEADEAVQAVDRERGEEAEGALVGHGVAEDGDEGTHGRRGEREMRKMQKRAAVVVTSRPW